MLIRPIIFLLLATTASATAGESNLIDEAVVQLVDAANTKNRGPGAAVDLLRIDELGDWLPAGRVGQIMDAYAKNRRRGPLLRAVAWWISRRRALDRLDMTQARAAQKSLGLLSGFVVRPGVAPDPLIPLKAEEWRPIPDSAGEVWLDAYLRPHRQTTATLATRLVAARAGPAVLRIGSDEQARVWLNGIEVQAQTAAGHLWLDRTAIPINLRTGDNLLLIEVTQREGAWRFVGRVTDARGRPMVVEGRNDPWIEIPEARAPADTRIKDLWVQLRELADADAVDHQARRDYADYVRLTRAPETDLDSARFQIEAAFEDEENTTTLLAWTRLLDESEREAIEAAHPPKTVAGSESRLAHLWLRLEAAWRHRQQQRTGIALKLVDGITAEAADFLPAHVLRSALSADAGLMHRGVRELKAARDRWSRRPAVERAWHSALHDAGRRRARVRALEQWHQTGFAGGAVYFELGVEYALRGQSKEALAMLEAVHGPRPELWTFGLEAADLMTQAGDEVDALVRLESLWSRAPGDGAVAARLSALRMVRGEQSRALAVLERAIGSSEDDAELRKIRARMRGPEVQEALGPSIEILGKLELPPGNEAVVLYQHARAEIQSNGRAVRRVRRVLRPITPEGARRHSRFEVIFVPGAQSVDVDIARLIKPDGRVIEPIRGERGLSRPGDRLYFDLQALTLRFPGAAAGDIIELAWTRSDLDFDPAFPGYYGELAYVQESIPRLRSVVEFTGPGAKELQLGVKASGLQSERVGSRFVFTNVPGQPNEIYGPGPSSLLGYVHATNVQDWAEVDRRYQALSAGRFDPNPRLAQLARKTVGELKDPAGIIERLYRLASRRIRYVGIEYGVHSFQPEKPAVTFARGYGDCKDKAALLIAMAGAVGVEARLALVRTRSAGGLDDGLASLAIFDHAMVYVPVLDIYVDPTVEHGDWKTLPPDDQGALVYVLGSRKAPVTIPIQAAEDNRREIEFKVDPKDETRATVGWRFTGFPAVRQRVGIEGAPSLKRWVAENLLGAIPGLEVETVRGEERDGLRIQAVVRWAPGVESTRALVRQFMGVNWLLEQGLGVLATRRSAVEIPYREIRRLTLRAPNHSVPGGAPLEPVVVKSPFGALAFEIETDPAGLRTTRVDWSLEAPRISPADYFDFRRWLAEIDGILTTGGEVRRAVR